MGSRSSLGNDKIPGASVTCPHAFVQERREEVVRASEDAARRSVDRGPGFVFQIIISNFIFMLSFIRFLAQIIGIARLLCEPMLRYVTGPQGSSIWASYDALSSLPGSFSQIRCIQFGVSKCSMGLYLPDFRDLGCEKP